MRSLVLVQVDQLRCLADSANGRFLNRVSFACQGDDAAVMVGIHFAIEKVNTFHFHRVDNCVNF